MTELADATSEAAWLRSLLESRSSCRAFRPDPVPASVVESILATAQRTASWCNTQPWQVVVTAGTETEAFREHLLRRVAEEPGGFDIDPPGTYEGVYRDRRRDAGVALYQSVGIGRADHEGRITQAMENYRFFGAPHVAIVTSEAALGPYGYVDCGGYVATFLLAVHSHGLGAIAQAAVAGYAKAVREHFALPATRHVVCAISFGHRDAEHPANLVRTERAALGEAAELRGFSRSDL